MMLTKSLVFLLIIVAISNAELSEEAYKDEEDYDYESIDDEDYYDGEFENSTDYNYSYAYNYEEEAELNYVPELITRPQRIVVNQGETAELPCEANDSSKFVRIWMKGGTMLFTGEVRSVNGYNNINVGTSSFSEEQERLNQKNTHDEEVESSDTQHERSSLIISNIQPNDAGEYTCRIMIRSTDEINVNHTIIVRKAGVAVVTNPVSGVLALSEGDNASLSCELLDDGIDKEEEENSRSIRSSRSLSIFTWTREGLQFSNSGKYTHLGTELNIFNITKSDAGFYFCTTKAKNGELVSGQIQIEVSFAPKIISLQKMAIKTGQGLIAEIVCTVTGEPIPKVTWYKGDDFIEFEDSRITNNHSGLRHTLTINRVRTDDSGRYICYAVNDLGSSQISVELSTETQDLLDYDIEMTPVLDSKITTENLRDSANKSPTFRLIQQIYDDMIKRSNDNKASIESIQGNIESELSSIRNFTRQSTDGGKGILSNRDENYEPIDLDELENQFFLDIRNIKQQITEMEREFGKDISDLLEFEKEIKTDVLKLWDNVYDMQELSNITSRNIDEMYDKDILILHNFRTETTNQLSKLQKDMETILRSVGQGYYENNVGSNENSSEVELEKLVPNTEPGGSVAWLRDKMEIMQDELKGLNDALQKQKQSDNVFRSQLQDVFEDVDNLKGRQRMMGQEQEKLKREIQRLKSEDIIDLTNRLDVTQENIEDIRQMQEESFDEKKSDSAMDNEKLLLVINEMTKLKNQIYYLQQSILIMKSNGQNNFGVNNENIEGLAATSISDESISSTSVLSEPTTFNTYTTKFVGNSVSSRKDELLLNQVEKISQQINECAPKSQFNDFAREMKNKMRECSDAIDDAKDRWKADKSLANTHIKRNITRLSRRLNGVSARLEAVENDAKKYNLIINGIPKTRKLERTTHLERLVKEFFQKVLKMPRLQFDEVERLKPEASKISNETIHDQKENIPVLVKFPSVRIKTSVLKASRSMSPEAKKIYSVGEDFTDTIKHHRRRLVTFARKRARITKKKWALKYNELYMNGRVFIFVEDKNRVIPKN